MSIRTGFSSKTLEIANRTQSFAMQSKIGWEVMKHIPGLRSPIRERLSWFDIGQRGYLHSVISKNRPHQVDSSSAGEQAAVVIAASKSDLASIQSYLHDPFAVEAVATLRKGSLHIGVKAVEGSLFADIDKESTDGSHVAVALLDKTDTLATTMGFWSPSEGSFMSVEDVQLMDSLPLRDYSNRYPNVPLVN